MFQELCPGFYKWKWVVAINSKQYSWSLNLELEILSRELKVKVSHWISTASSLVPRNVTMHHYFFMLHIIKK